MIAIRIDNVRVGGSRPELHRTLDRPAAEGEAWFDGPPYAVAKHVFDEDDIDECSPSAEPSV